MLLEESVKVRNKFVKDKNLSIPILESPYFEHYINRLDVTFEYSTFLYVLSELGEDKFLFLRKEITDAAIEYIKSRTQYEDFQDHIPNVVKSDIPNINLYHPENHGKSFISIDMKNANFQIMKRYAKILNFECYKDFIAYIISSLDSKVAKNETIIDYFTNSKTLRQYIFGNCNPKKQQQIQKNIINKVANDLLEKDCLVYKLSSDELIVTDDYVNPYTYGYEFTCTGFYLYKFVEDRDIYVKQMPTGVSLVGCPKYLYPQYYAILNDHEIEEMDLYFYQDRNIARFEDVDFALKSYVEKMKIYDDESNKAYKFWRPIRRNIWKRKEKYNQ